MVYDSIIIGSGPAGHTAAGFVKEYNCLLLEGDMAGGIAAGGQLTTTTNVDNYPGYVNGTQGPDMMDSIRKDCPIPIKTETVTDVVKNNNIFIVKTEKDVYKAKSVIISTGAHANKLYVPNSDKFWNNGISACAICDGFLFMDKVCGVIGGGDSAFEEALYLSNICKKVYLIHRKDVFRGRKDKLEIIKNTKNIEIITNSELKECHGSDYLESITLKHKNREDSNLVLDGLFYAIGHTPNTEFLKNLNLDTKNKYLIADKNCKTSVDGLFACGDVQDYFYRQAVTAAGSGAIAGISCCEFLKK